MRRPNSSGNELRKAERTSTFSIPSAAQKRLSAKGRSMETLSTLVPGRSAARLLKVRTEVAQTPVSTLGKTLRTFLPGNEEIFASGRSALTSAASGAVEPTAG